MAKVNKAAKARTAKRVEKKVEKKATKTEQSADATWKGKNDGTRGVEMLEAAKVEQQQRDPTVGPMVTRALQTLAKQLELGGDVNAVVMEAAKEFAGSPEAMAAFKRAVPFLEKNAVQLSKKAGVPLAGKMASGALPLLADGEIVKAVLKMAGDAGGPEARRLVGAAMRGLNSGQGLAGAAAEVAATSAKIGAKASLKGTAGKLLADTLPIIGNGLNLMMLGSSVRSLYHSFRDDASAGQRLARFLHLAATVTGCFIPPVGYAATAIDVGASLMKANVPSRA